MTGRDSEDKQKEKPNPEDPIQNIMLYTYDTSDILYVQPIKSLGLTEEGVITMQYALQKSIEGSMCFGVYCNDRQVGFARMVTDNATFAYLADVFIIEKFRGRGLSKWLMECILSHNNLQGLRRILLATKDAHRLYTKFGFTPLNNPDRFMHIYNPDVYKNAE